MILEVDVGLVPNDGMFGLVRVLAKPSYLSVAVCVEFFCQPLHSNNYDRLVPISEGPLRT
jgi:hypothetical protein